MEPSEECALGPVLPAPNPNLLSSPSWTLVSLSSLRLDPSHGPRGVFLHQRLLLPFP